MEGVAEVAMVTMVKLPREVLTSASEAAAHPVTTRQTSSSKHNFSFAHSIVFLVDDSIVARTVKPGAACWGLSVKV